MKQLVLSLAILISFSGLAQEGTTLEEYRYLSKGYVYQLEMGLDAQKEGYLVKNLFQASNGADLVGLYHIGNPQPRALLVVLNNDKGEADYICIPNGTADKRVRDLAATDHNQISAQQKVDHQVALNEFLFAALSNPNLKTVTFQKSNNRPTSYGQDETLVSRSANLEEFIVDAPVLDPPRIEKVTPTTQNNSKTKVAVKTVKGEISQRAILQSEEAYAATNSRGVIAIKVCVNANGEVTTAKFTQRGSTTFNSSLKKAALEAARSTKFASSELSEQCGIINYKF